MKASADLGRMVSRYRGVERTRSFFGVAAL
jgi:hypothetical protein